MFTPASWKVIGQLVTLHFPIIVAGVISHATLAGGAR
jgi:hypothetical protein